MPSVCLSTPDLLLCDPFPPDGSGSPLSPPPEPDEDEALDEDPVDAAPFALARDVDLIMFFAIVFTYTFLALTLRDTLDSVLSFNTEIEKDPPTPQLEPAAAALAASWRLKSLFVETLRSPDEKIDPSPEPIFATVSVPETRSERTGVMEMPPAEPATELTVWASV